MMMRVSKLKIQIISCPTVATNFRTPPVRELGHPHVIQVCEGSSHATGLADAPDENGLHPPPEGPRFDFLRGADAAGRPLLAQKT